MSKTEQHAFFLGGRDLEMATIGELLVEEHRLVYDKQLTWHDAVASSYADEIAKTLESDATLVLVELRLDLEIPRDRWIEVDHHGPLAGFDRPTSLHQIFELLALPRQRWTRWYQLVAENDRGHVEAMQAMGASQREITRTRAADRAAQGITEAQECSASRSLDSMRSLAGGALTIVSLDHSRTAAVTDRLHRALGGPGYHNLLVNCPTEVNFFGEGNLILALAEAFPGGWYGGALPKQGFWGHELTRAEPQNVEDFLIKRLHSC